MRILFIDDDKYIRISTREFLKIYFEKKMGVPVTIVEAVDGQQGLDKLAAESFDCIILDGRMPMMSGEEFLKKYDGDLPIIYSSAFHGTEAGGKVSAILEKPYDCFELGAMIMRLVAERRST